MDIIGALTAAGTIFTGFAVLVGVRQLKTTENELELIKEQARTSFEDDLSREYRSIVASLPAEAFFREGIKELDDPTRRAFFRYFDLSNEELFLAKLGRIGDDTKLQWVDGILGNLRLPAFSKAWADVLEHIPDDFFEDLRELLAQQENEG
jgi:hypothetical protein